MPRFFATDRFPTPPTAPGRACSRSPSPNPSAGPRGAGFRDIACTPPNVPLSLGTDPDEAAEYLADTGPGRAVLDTIAENDKPAALDAVRAALADHTDNSGVHLDAGIWIVTALGR